MNKKKNNYETSEGKKFQIKTLFKISRDINPKLGNVKIGKYVIKPLPCNQKSLADSQISYLLEFQDTFRDRDKTSQPTEDSQLFLSFFSLLIKSRLEIDSFMVNNVKVNRPNSVDTDIYKEYRLPIADFKDLDFFLNKLKSLDYEIAKQFLRACSVYRTALNLIGYNNTLSYFLLCVSIECLSNKISNKNGKCAKFIDFTLTYLPDKSDFDTEKKWKKILKVVYYMHRSGFTHGGKSIPAAVLMADKHNRKYIKNYIDGKEVLTPGLKWFENVVRNTLIGFLGKVKLKAKNKQEDFFKKISLEYGRVMLKAKAGRKKDIKLYHFVTAKDVELD